jgi:hypothetical protein
MLMISMRKTALALTLIFSAILSLLSVESQNTIILVNGNFLVGFGSILIVAPENKTYHSSTLTLSYRATFPQMGLAAPELAGIWGHKWIVYSLDGGQNVTVYSECNDSEGYNGSVALSGLSSGNHCIEIYSKNGTFASIMGTGGDAIWGDAYYRVFFEIVLPGGSPTPTPSPSAAPEATSQSATFPATQSFVASIGIALAVIGLFVYFKKHRGAKNP